MQRTLVSTSSNLLQNYRSIHLFVALVRHHGHFALLIVIYSFMGNTFKMED